MTNLLEVTNQCQHRQERLDHHPIIPGFGRADLQVSRVPAFLLEMRVSKGDHLIGHGIHQVLKGAAIVNIGCGGIPTYHLADVVQEQTQLTADYPAFVGQSFPANLFVAASFPSRVNQFDAVTINHADHRRLGQQAGVIGAGYAIYQHLESER